MAKHTYDGIRITQQPGAPPFYLTSVSASELLKWCDVPRAKGDYMAGYQRALHGKRTAALATYLSLSPRNIIPGAVIVAVDSDAVAVAEKNGLIRLEIGGEERSFDERLQELFGAFTTRLSSEELDSANIDFSATDWDSAAGEDSESEYPSSYLALLTQELNLALTDWESLSKERQEAIREFIDGVSKPGLIIDGQHRVFGAAELKEKDIVLPVVLLPGLDYAEQVFQFYVLNSKAKPLKPTELRRIVSTALTNQEIEDLYDRFRQAGVDANEARWTHEMNTRPESPFRHLIDFGYGEPGAM